MHSSLSPFYARLQKSMVDLLEEIKDQPDSVLNEKPEKGGWSVLQVIYHVVLVEEVSLAYVKKKLSFGDNIPKAGIKQTMRAGYLRSFMHTPIKVKAPTLVNEDHMPTDIRFWEVLKKWKDNRAELQEFLDNMPDK